MRIALITGASGGIGRALANRLRADCWQLALVGRDATRLAEAATAADASIIADVSTEAGAASALAATLERFSAPPTALAHCAGNSLIAPVTRTREADYRGVLAANLDSAFFTLKAWLGALTDARQPGSAVLFSSVVAAIGVANHAAIAAAKAGVEALVRSLAADYSGAGIRLNAIAPGLTRTPLTARMLTSERSREQVALQYPLGRHGEAEDAAALAAFLLSDNAGWITGQTIALDGGFTAVRPLVRAANA